VDEALFRAVNGVSGPWWDAVMVAATSSTNWLAPLGLLVAAMVAHNPRRGGVAIVAAALAVGLGDALGGHLLKPLFSRPRPCEALEGVRVLMGCGAAYSLPSNHAINSFAVAGALGGVFPWLLLALVPVGLLVAVSRVAVGAHYVSDVAVGAALGFALGLLFAWMGRALLRRRARRADG